MGWVESRLEFLRLHQNSDGGWGYFPGRESRVEPTCYALRAIRPTDAAFQSGVSFLAARQDKSGGLTPGANIPGATWVTQLAFPLLKQGNLDRPRLESAANWILNTEGAEGGIMQRLLHSMGKSKVDQDPKLRGWPWRPDNNSWVEPTAHGLIALHWMNDLAPEAGIRYRRDVATRMLLDRRCLDFGWNYGNKKVLGEVLPAYPETTGLALLGLAGLNQDLSQSLVKARQQYAETKGAYGKALLALALQLHGDTIAYESEHPEVHPSRNLMLAGLEVLAAHGSKANLIP